MGLVPRGELFNMAGLAPLQGLGTCPEKHGSRCPAPVGCCSRGGKEPGSEGAHRTRRDSRREGPVGLGDSRPEAGGGGGTEGGGGRPTPAGARGSEGRRDLMRLILLSGRPGAWGEAKGR